MSRRRAFLASLASFSALSACGGGSSSGGGGGSTGGTSGGGIPALTPTAAPSAAPSVAPSGAGLPTTIVNNTGFPNSQVFFYLFGGDTAKVTHRLKADGTTVPVSLSDYTAGGNADFAIPLPSSGSMSFTFPHLGGRMYFSIGAKLPLKVVGSVGSLGVASPNSNGPNDSAHAILNDFIEYSYQGNVFNVNTTMVDAFGLPIQITLQGSRTQTSGVGPGARSQIFAALRQDPVFKNVITTINGTDMRAVSAAYAAGNGLIPSTYLDPYIRQVWDFFKTNTMTIAGQPNVTGTVDANDNFNFVNNGQPYISFTLPSTEGAFGGPGGPQSPNTPAGGIGVILSSALCRTTLLQAAQPDYVAADFYKNPLTNVYARVLHQFSVNNKCYAFPFDDAGGFSSFIADSAPQSFEIVLQPF